MFTGKPFILDGATGTMLQAAGMTKGMCPEQWILENPQVIITLQKRYFAAGSNAVYAPTFGANREKLSKFGIMGKTVEFNARLVELSQKAAMETGGLVAGDMAPLGLFTVPYGDETFDTICAVYYEQALALERAGVDFFAVETMMTISEARAAVLAIREVSKKPIICTFTCDENGRTLSGGDIAAALIIMQSMGVSAFGLNCSNGPEGMLENMKKLVQYARIPLVAKPNAGIPHETEHGTEFDMSPDELGAFAPRFMSLGAGVLGGCCGSTPEHIAALKKASDTAELSAPHGDDTLVAATERSIFHMQPDVDITSPIKMSPDFAEDILDAEDELGILHVRIDDAIDVHCLEENQYMLNDALCISSYDEELLESALRVYNGRAVYSGEPELTAEKARQMAETYGVIELSV